jgi:hypothetical protein
MTIEAVVRPTLSFPRTWRTLDDILQDMPRLRLEVLVVVRTSKFSADALEVEAVAWLLLAEAGVVYGPFFLCWRADICVDALVILIECYGVR